MKESTPAALSAMGAVTLFAVAVCSYFVAGKAADASRLLTKVTYHFDSAKPPMALSEPERKERIYQGIIISISNRVGDMEYDLRKRGLIDAVVDSPSLSFFSFVGSGLLVASALADWALKRAKGK